MHTDEAPTSELTIEAFRFLARTNWVEAHRILNNLFRAGDQTKIDMGLGYLYASESKVLAYAFCLSKIMAEKLGLTKSEWRVALKLRRAQAKVVSSGFSIPGYIDLSYIDGPLTIPICDAQRINLAKASKLLFPFLTIVNGGFLNVVGSYELSFPVLSVVRGDVAAYGAREARLPVIESISSDLDVRQTEDLVLPKLSLIGGDLRANESTGLHLPSLTKIFGTLNSRNCSGFSAPLLK